jgi:hypothetical protein
MATPSGGMRRPCSGRMSRFRQKSIEISNVFRGALGLPLIDPNAHRAPHRHNGKPMILPTNPDELQFLKHTEPKPSDEYRVVSFKQPVKEDMKHKWGHTEDVKWLKVPEGSMNHEWVDAEEDVSHHHGGGPHHPGAHHRVHIQRGHRGFVQRLHHSLMNLGLWEGRAVAFVLGCGIGVLLRMFWVLAVVAYRVIKRRPGSEEDEYTHITIFEEVEVEAPPHYTYPVDEKAAVEPETKAAEPAVAAASEESK